MTLVDRSVERAALGGLLARAAEGLSGTLVLRGEPGVGKTALLDDTIAAATAGGMRTARLTGVESETQLGYAALHRLLLPFPRHLDRLPGPQRDALRSTFGLVAGPPADRFLVALGVLTLLADVALQVPLLCVVDDVQWLDPESAAVLGFVARRLCAERVALLLAVRKTADQAPALSGLPELTVGGLGDREAVDLLSSITGGQMNAQVGARLLAETGGNPLALVELARNLSPAQLAGGAALPDPLPVGHSVEEVFSPRVNRLPPEARLLLAVAAAEPTAPHAMLWRAAGQLGIDPDAAASIDMSDLVVFDPQVAFRHPLVRSVAYHGTPLSQRRLIHQALAAAGTAGEDSDRMAWHLGMAALGPDDAVAARLEQAAERARDRGGYAATATFLSRAAELSVDEGLLTRRLLAAADAELTAGAPDRASELLDQAQAGPASQLQAGVALQLSGQISLAAGQLTEATSRLLAAARTLMPVDPSLGRQTLLHALEAANQAGRPALEEVRAVAAEILPVASAADVPLTVVDRLLFGFMHRFAGEYRQAAPLLHSAVAELQDETAAEELRLPWMRIGTFAATDLLDEEAKAAVPAEYARLARRRGALTALPLALVAMADAYLREGRFSLTEDAYSEARQIATATGNPGIYGPAIPDVVLLCWRGQEAKARAAAAEVIANTVDRGLDAGVNPLRGRLVVLELGLGNYPEALGHAQEVYRQDLLGWGTWILPELVEAAARCGELRVAQEALDRLTARAQASGAPWALGLLARSRGLVAEDAEAELLYTEAIALLQSTRALFDLARSHLVYGEWLRRQRRRRDARDQLRTAHDMLADMGADGFARRARIELNATGERARQRSVGAPDALTPQETQIARLVSEGETNRDIASQLFISPSTVEYHLRKVYRKLGVTSRTQLVRATIANGM